MPINNDQVAEAVDHKSCPKIDSLRKVWKSGKEYFYIKGKESYSLNVKGKSFKLFTSGSSKRLNGDHKGAIIDLTKSLKINPFNAIAYSYRASSKEELKDYDSAISDYKKCLDLKPKSSRYNDLA